MTTYRSFIRNNLLVLTGQVLVYAQGIILMPIIIKTVGVTVYGGYVLLMSLVGFFFGISSLGVGFRRMRFLPSAQDKETRRSLFFPQFYCQLASILCLSLILIWLFPAFDKWFFKRQVVFSVGLVVPYFIFYLIYSQTSDYFRYTNKMNYFNSAIILYTLLNIVIILLYSLYSTLTVNVLFAIQIVSSISVGLPLAWMMVQEIGIATTLPTVSQLADDIKLGLPLVLSYVVDVILSFSDRYVITAFLSVTAVGYYNPGYSLGSLVVLFPRIFGVVLPPLLSRAVDTGEETEARIMVDYAVKGFLLVAIPFVIGAAVMAKPLLTLLANAEVAQQAYGVTLVVALGTVFYGLGLILANVLLVRMKTAAMLTINLMAAILNVVINVVFFYFIRNIMVAAVSTMVSYLASFIFIGRLVHKNWPMDFHLKVIIKSLVASLCMGASLQWLSWQLGSNAARLIYVLGEIGLGIIVYCLALLALRTFSAKELDYVRKALSS